MGTVTIEFIGLFLFNSAKEGEKRVAVIDADRDGEHGGKSLPRHEAFFTATGVSKVVDWPHDGSHYELAGTIQFEAQGTLRAPEDRWTLPRIASGCPSLEIPDSFFVAPSAGATQAIIVIRAGELCAWRFTTKDGRPGAVNTRLTIEAAESFAITRDDGTRIELDPAQDPVIHFTNTEPVETADDRDWYWYYVAAGSKCVADPDPTGIKARCDAPEGLNPLSLGCSNSNYP
jgi:hypothetical protein